MYEATIREDEEADKHEFGKILEIKINNKVVFLWNENHSEPEDLTLYRDLSWIPVELMRAYQQGREDMHKQLEF